VSDQADALSDQAEKAKLLRSLHIPGAPLVLPQFVGGVRDEPLLLGDVGLKLFEHRVEHV
jgi:hypothetical protein